MEAAAIIEAGRKVVETGWHLGGKVRLVDVASELGTTVVALGPRLLELNRANDLQLYRADLVIDSKREAASKLQDGPATYHYLLVPGVRAW